MSRATLRLGKELRQRLADIFEQRVADPRLEGLSLVEVRPSPDLTYARIFYRTLARDPGEVEAALRKALPFVRRCLAEGSRHKRVPELDFRLDPSAEASARIEGVLRELAEEREQREEGGDADAEVDGAPDGPESARGGSS